MSLDRGAHLGQVLGAVGAAGEVRLEPAAVAWREPALEVVGHQLDRSAAHDRGGDGGTASLPPGSSSNSWRSRLRPGAAGPAGSPRSRPAPRTPLAAHPFDVAEQSRPARWRAGSAEPAGRGRRASGVEAVVHPLDPGLRRAASRRRRRTGAARPTAALTASAPGTLRCSCAPAVLARLTRIRNSQVFNDDRPSKPSMPRTPPSQVSWTTSSATARLGTNEDASRSIGVVVALDQGDERPLVTGAQRREQLRVGPDPLRTA